MIHRLISILQTPNFNKLLLIIKQIVFNNGDLIDNILTSKPLII